MTAEPVPVELVTIVITAPARSPLATAASQAGDSHVLLGDVRPVLRRALIDAREYRSKGDDMRLDDLHLVAEYEALYEQFTEDSSV